jgi:hypothetical protein
MFWLEATWFLPALVSLYYGRSALNSAKMNTIFAILLFFSLLIMYLCGFEFITTIGLSTLSPIIYYHYKYNSGTSNFVRTVSSIFIVSFLAFFVASALQAAKIAKSFPEGLDYIKVIAIKNVVSKDPAMVAKIACSDKFMQIVNPEDCADEYIKSQKASPLTVVGTYFAFRHLLPWVDQLDAPIRPGVKESLKRVLKDRSVIQLLKMFRSLDSSDKWRLLFVAAQSIIFICFIALLAVKLADASVPPHWRWLIVLSFLAPLSWFFLAKAHSYIHTHLNYVLWYIGFMPFSVLFIVSSKVGEHR